MIKKRTKPGKLALVAQRRQRLVELVKTKPMTIRELSLAMQVPTTTVYKDTLQLKKQIYVADWVGIGEVRMIPLFAYGCKPDAPMPEKKRAMLEKRMATVEAANNPAPAPKRTIRVFRHWLDVALFGEYRAAA